MAKPLHRCMACGGSKGRTVNKVVQYTEMINDPKTGKKVPVTKTKTVPTWEPCKRCGGSGVG